MGVPFTGVELEITMLSKADQAHANVTCVLTYSEFRLKTKVHVRKESIKDDQWVGKGEQWGSPDG